MHLETFTFVTDTATLCVFDPQRLRHRLVDDADWWSIPSAEIEEINNGNALFVNLGADGRYYVTVEHAAAISEGTSVLLAVESGRVFVGAGEEATADGLEPDGIHGGGFIKLPAGTYQLTMRRIGAHEVALSFATAEGRARNSLDLQIRV
jgi:hypothetical protein